MTKKDLVTQKKLEADAVLEDRLLKLQQYSDFKDQDMVSFDNKVRDTPESRSLRAQMRAYKPSISAKEKVKTKLCLENFKQEVGLENFKQNHSCLENFKQTQSEQKLDEQKITDSEQED